jgi:hypothetical protein
VISVIETMPASRSPIELGLVEAKTPSGIPTSAASPRPAYEVLAEVSLQRVLDEVVHLDGNGVVEPHLRANGLRELLARPRSEDGPDGVARDQVDDDGEEDHQEQHDDGGHPEALQDVCGHARRVPGRLSP